MIRKLIKHDRYVEHLCRQIKHNYDYLLRHVPLYSRKKRLIAEIDVLAFKEDYCDIYEVKCSYREHKARKQIDKIRRILACGSRIRNGFFFCGESGMLVTV